MKNVMKYAASLPDKIIQKLRIKRSIDFLLISFWNHFVKREPFFYRERRVFTLFGVKCAVSEITKSSGKFV